MSSSPPYLSPGVDAWAEVDARADVDTWADADAEVAPSAGQLEAWFAHPSAVLADAGVAGRGPAPTTLTDAASAAAGPVDPAGVPGWVEVEWLVAPVRPAVRGLMSLTPGPGLLAALACLPSGPCPDPHADLAVHDRPVPGSAPGFVCACQVVTAAAWDVMATWTGAQAAVQLVDIAGQDPVTVLPDGAPVAARTVDPCRVELAPMLHLSPDSTGTRLAQGRALTEHPALVQACTAGLITAAGARAIVDETGFLSRAATAQVVTAVVAKVLARRAAGTPGWTASELRQVAKRAVAALADDAKEQARHDAYNDRRVSLTSAGHGMAWLSFLIRDVDAHRIYNRLTAQAAAAKAHANDHHTADHRTANQHRADIAAATLLICRGGLSSGHG